MRTLRILCCLVLPIHADAFGRHAMSKPPLPAPVQMNTQAFISPLIAGFRRYQESIHVSTLLGHTALALLALKTGPAALGAALYRARLLRADQSPPTLRWWPLLLETALKDPSRFHLADLDALSIHLPIAIAQSALSPQTLKDPKALHQKRLLYQPMIHYAEQTLALLKYMPARNNEEEILLFNSERRLVRLIDYARHAENAALLFEEQPLAEDFAAWGAWAGKWLDKKGFTPTALTGSILAMQRAGNDLMEGLFNDVSYWQSPRGQSRSLFYPIQFVIFILTLIVTESRTRVNDRYQRQIIAYEKEFGVRSDISFSDYTHMTRKRWAIKKRDPRIVPNAPDGRHYSLDLILVMAGSQIEKRRQQVKELEAKLRLPPLPVLFYDPEMAGPEASLLQDPLEAEIYLRALWSRLPTDSDITAAGRPELRPIREGLPFERARVSVLEVPSDEEGPYGSLPTPIGFDGEDAGEAGMGTFLENLLDLLYQGEPYRAQEARCLLLGVGHSVDFRPPNRGVSAENRTEGKANYALSLARVTAREIEAANQIYDGLSLYGMPVPILSTYEKRYHPHATTRLFPELTGFYSGKNALQDALQKFDPDSVAAWNPEARSLFGYDDLMLMNAAGALPIHTEMGESPMNAWDIALALYHKTAVVGRKLMKKVPAQIAHLAIPHILVSLVIQNLGFELHNYRTQVLEESEPLSQIPLDGGGTWLDALRVFLDGILSHIDKVSDLFIKEVVMSVDIPPEDGYFSLVWPDPKGAWAAMQRIAQAPRTLSDEAFNALEPEVQRIFEEIRGHPQALKAYHAVAGTRLPHFWEISPEAVAHMRQVLSRGA